MLLPGFFAVIRGLPRQPPAVLCCCTLIPSFCFCTAFDFSYSIPPSFSFISSSFFFCFVIEASSAMHRNLTEAFCVWASLPGSSESSRCLSAKASAKPTPAAANPGLLLLNAVKWTYIRNKVGANSLFLNLSHSCLEIFPKPTKFISLTMWKKKPSS